MNGPRPKTRPTGFVPSADAVASLPKTELPPNASTALKVRECYVRARRLWEERENGHASSYTPPRSYDQRRAITVEGELVLEPARASIWEQLATWCRKHRIDVLPYIQFQFECLQPGNRIRRALEPRDLMSEPCRALWRKHLEAVEATIAASLSSEAETAETYIVCSQKFEGRKYDDACAGVITSRAVEISPLLRYCLAVSLKGDRFRPIAARYFESAARQFSRYPRLYLVYWKDMLPEGFSKKCRESFPNLFVERT